jgi:hypothetical protein
MTISGVTCWDFGKSAPNVGKITRALPPSTGTRPTDAGVLASKYSTASCLPDASGCGEVSIPSPVEIRCGVPPAVGTDQMCRRSMSLAFVQ